MSTRLRDRRGFALPMVILLVALLTVLLTSGLTRARTERQIAHASDETGLARVIAQSGLQAYIGTTVARPADGDSSRVNLSGGYANVVVHLVRRPADTTQRSLYIVRSTGIVINPDSGARGQARHTMAQFAEWESGSMLHRAAFTAAGGARKKNGAATIAFSGTDQCSARPPIPGLRTTQVTDGPNPLPTYQGSPGLLEEGAGTGPVVAAQTLINWPGALGADLMPDYTSFQQGNFGFPIQRILGNLSLSGISFGSGLLVVSGDFTLTTSFFYFEGIILVGGKIDFDGDFMQVRGVVVSGLNEQLGTNPNRSEFGGTGKNLFLYYDSCKVQLALAPLTGLSAVRNAWMDLWAY